MFGKLSRYRKVQDVAVLDPRGRVLASKDLRLLPDTPGTFAHTVESGDRLDQLAFTFYGDPALYWRFCDANPAFLSPLALLGQEPVVTLRFPLTAPAGDPPWSALLVQLRALAGVEAVAPEEESTLVTERQTVGGRTVAVQVEHFTRSVTVVSNRIAVRTDQLRAAIVRSGFTPGPAEETGQLGRPVIIPPAPSG
ncbi:hypothetical protein [Streptomyces sp. ODS28]|uniref:hypothetical protein n=1 Tax=Streptomyces sp. ODS28 TaxID=3136688 RepID=UPI0031EC7612